MKKDQQQQPSNKSKDQQQQQSRNQDDTLEQCNERLRDLYMNYKDLVYRCLIDIKQAEKGDKRVFYFKPETFLLEDPEKQKVYREKLLKKITQIPHPEPITFMGDELHKQMLETIQDRSQPQITRKNLAHFFKRRQYTLQHKKYKVLIRWAHHALTTEYMERIGHEATFKYGKMEYEMENAMNRYERLEAEDDYENASTFPRPNTKAKEGGSLYVENTELEPTSSIRMDDVEVYLRQVTYEQKINKLVNKFLARLKWLPLYRRYDIWSDAVEGYNTIKEQNLKRQEDILKKIIQRGEIVIPKNNQDLLDELETIIEQYNISTYRAKITNKADQIMYSQKCDHEEAPKMIENSLELKIHILDKALEYGIYGDIELDQGYSFAYQITIFFPTYFQRQIIKSQFSLYDAFAGEEKDQNSIQKRNLQNMLKIDTNIFRDISTTKNNIPSQESLNLDDGFKNLKISRLKSCSSWIDYCGVLQPKIPTYIQKQTAYLSINNPIDSLLKSALNFLDVNDLATVNRILEETARLHQAQQKERTMTQSSKNKKKKVSNNIKKQDPNHGKPNMHDEINNMKDHFTSALKGDISTDQKDNLRELPTINPNSLRYLPQHLIHAYYILRHMKSRDYKLKMLYCLNYFRAVQKRLVLDLREFSTRERILGDLVQPIIPANEADKVSQINANSSYFKNVQDMNQHFPNKVISAINQSNKDDKTMIYKKQAEQEEAKEKNFSLFEDGYLKSENNLVDMKKYKFKGKFNNRIFSTCPVIPRFHATFGEPIDYQPLNVEMERIGSIKHATDEGVKLMGRVDHIEIDMKNKEVYVKDDFGIHIVYDCSLADMKELEEDILKIGSYFIGKHEILINTENEKPYPVIDRLSLMEDLLEGEHGFQFQKVLLLQAYMECYEHISDPLEQQRLMQIIIDIMAQRPRLNLGAAYFRDSYTSEIQCLQKHTELLKTIIVNQMNIEKEENKRIQAYLDLTYKIANDQIKGKWTYADAEDFYNELKKRKASNSFANGGATDSAQEQETQDKKEVESSEGGESKEKEDNSPTKRFLKKINDKQYGSKFQQQNEANANNKGKTGAPLEAEIQGGFAAVLGLPPITVESLYMQYKEKDEIIIDVMNENSNFIRVYEGYPDFHIVLQGLQNNKLCQYRFSEWSNPINILDFFDSLGFITKLYATVQSVYTELIDVLKPHDNTLLTLIETKIWERSFIEYQKTKAFFTEDLKEFKGAEYLEDETIVGNSDKITFYVKDLMSHLQKTLKQNVNPFYIAKLDLETINFFDFPSLPKEKNPFSNPPLQLKDDMELSLKIADHHTRPTVGSFQRFFPQLKEYMRKINIPSMLTLYCNTIELLRLRQELLFAISETIVLTEVYEAQCKLVNRQNFKVQFTDQINFDNYLIDQTKINFVDDGPAKTIEFDISLNEFDQMLKSNLNFRSADAFKMLICKIQSIKLIGTSGLEELRGALHYQLMQKQLLIIGVRMNQLLLDTHMRALTELELVKKGFSLPNMIIKLQTLISKTGDGFSYDHYQRERQRFQSNLVNEAAPVFYYVGSRKTKLRNTVSKKFSVFLTSVASTFGKVECSLRVLRTYKLKLLHSYCNEVMKEAYYDSMKIQALNSCQKLRLMSQIFSIDDSIIGMTHGSNGNEKPQIFKYENHEFYENFFASYNPIYSSEYNQMAFAKEQTSNQAALNIERCEILNHFMLPSSITLLKCESVNYEELTRLNNKFPSFDFQAIPDENDVELSLKQMITNVVFQSPEYPKEDPENDRKSLRIVDFQNSYDFSNSVYAQMITYYALIERIFNLEYFMNKISSNLIDVLNMEQTIFSGLPFWSIDSELEQNLKNQQIDTQRTQLSDKILNKIVSEKRAKVNLADDVINFAQQLVSLIKKVQLSSQNRNSEKSAPGLIPQGKILEYLITYQEYKYYFLVHTLDKLIESYFQKNGLKEIRFIYDTYQQLTRKDHVKIVYKHNAFHSNASLTRAEQFSLETSNLIQPYCNNEEFNDFNVCIQPIINEQAMSPAQITLFEGMFANQKIKSTQYAGQIPNYPRLYPCLETAMINLNDQERVYVNSTVHSIKGFLKDYLEVIHKETVDFNEEGLTLDQLRKGKKFLGELIQARSLKNALICWLSNSTIPLDPQIYSQFLQQYKNDIFWKIMNQKDQLPQINSNNYQNSQKSVMSDYQTDSQQKEKNKQAEQSMILSQQLLNMQMQVLVDQVQTCKAEIIVLSNEIERQLVKAAIKAVDSESAALANCFSLNSKAIELHIHPFQQFAATCYADVDQSSHLDMVTKVSEVQRFITKLRNRGTEVETLTSGPGMVFTIKDFNECLQILCRGLIKYSEKELRSRSELLAKKEQHYIQLLYVKDRKLENLEERIQNTRDNLDKLINSKMYEKGNQLIYELDQVNRQLRLFKDNIFAMERELKSNIRAEFAETLRKNMRDIDISINKFKDFKNDVTTKVKADLAQEQHKIEKVLKKKAEEFKNLSVSTNKESILKSRVKFDHHDSMTNQLVGSNNNGTFSYLDEINKLTEREARQELAQMCDLMRKMRIFWKTKEILTVDKYEKEIFTLKKQQTSNACLWEQLAEAEKREKVLKQELVFTQQSLAASEKVIEKLKDDLRKSESDRIRLNQYKTNKSQRLEELEGKVRKFEVLENINLEKLIDTLGTKEKEIMKLKDIEKNFSQRLEAIEKRKDSEVKDYKSQYQRELILKRDVLERLEGLRMELRMLEKNEGSMAEVWKTKCKELVEICSNLKTENEQLRTRVYSMAQNMSSQSEQEYNQSKIEAQDGLFQLPKLLPNANHNKMLSNIQASKYGGGTTASHTRHSSVAKNDSQLVGPSIDKSLLGGTIGQFQENSTISKGPAQLGTVRVSHQRGKSINDSLSQSKISEHSSIMKNAQVNLSNQGKISSQRFAVKGQQATILSGKGYQSVRTSQVGTNQYKMNDDMQDYMLNNSGSNAKNIFKYGIDMTNTATSISKNLIGSGANSGIRQINDTFQHKAVGQSSDMSQTGVLDSRKIKRKESKDRYSQGGQPTAIGSAHQKKSNVDLSAFIQTDANSPNRQNDYFENQLHNQNQQDVNEVFSQTTQKDAYDRRILSDQMSGEVQSALRSSSYSQIQQ